MSSDMNLSALLQSELYCTPTQVILIDAMLESNFVRDLLDSLNCSHSDFIDHIKVEDHFSAIKTESHTSHKAQYAKYRVSLLSNLLALFERRLVLGTKERCVIIVLGNVEDPISRTCLMELPLDAANLIFWKTGHLPGVLRMATTLENDIASSQANLVTKSFKPLFDGIREQYFEMPRFEGETTSKRISGDAPGAIATSTRPSNSHLLCVNPYDILICSSTLAPLERFFREILPLQQLEASYATSHLSSEYGSGGSLYLVEGRLVSSVSGWRRADWLVLAQSAYLPRFWCLDDKKTSDEFVDLFKYRHWVSRFDGLEETDQSNLEIIAFPDSDRKTLKKALKNIANMNLQRRKRESGWDYTATKLDSLTAVKLKPAVPQSRSVTVTALSSKSSSSKGSFNPLLHETNPYRVTEAHFEVFREVVIFLNREEKFSESLKVIRTYVRGAIASDFSNGAIEDVDSRRSNPPSPVKSRHTGSRRVSPTRTRGRAGGHVLIGTSKCPPDFDKLEGISLLGSGDKEEAIQMLERYRRHLESEEQDRRLLSQKGDEKEEKERNLQSARVWSEISGIYCACGNFKAAQSMADKALELDGSLTAAQKTLVLAVGRTGESSFQEEDWIFSFFATAKTVQLEEATSFYAKRTEKFPANGYFWYGYAMLNFVVARDFECSSEPLFQRALDLLPEEGRIAEAFATYLFQTRSPQIARIQSLYASAMQLDPSNLVLRANSASFLLFLRSAQLSRLEDGSIQYSDCEAPEVYAVKGEVLLADTREAVMDGFDEAQNFLESALFSVSLVDEHPQVYLECWFYVLCYTMERARATQALQYIKAALRKGIRARNWDMHMHIRFLRRRRLFDENDTRWAPKLATVIADRLPLEILDDWKLWCSLKSDKLVLNLKLAPHSFRVCVSPSKRREKKEEFTPPSFFKTKSAPLASMASSSIAVNSPTLSRGRSRAKPTASSPFNAKKRETTKRFVSTPTVSPAPPEPSAKAPLNTKTNGNSRTTNGSAPILKKSASELTKHVTPPATASSSSMTSKRVNQSKSTPTRTPQADGEDDILNLLSTHSSSLSTPPAADYSYSPPLSADSSGARQTSRSLAGERPLKRQSSALTSSAGSILFSESAVAPTAIRKTKSPPLSVSSAKNAKSTASRTGRSRNNSPSITSEKMDVTQNDQVWEQLMDKYKDSDDILNSLETSSSSRATRSTHSPILRNASETISRPRVPSPQTNFTETAPKRPSRSASGGLPAAKRSKGS